MINNDAFDFEFVRMNDLLTAVAAAMAGLFGSIILFFVGGSRLPNTKFYKKVALVDTQQSTEGYTSNFLTTVLTGKRGVSQTVLRPSGKVSIDGMIYDAYTRGEYIEKGFPVEVINVTGSSIQVKVIKDNV